MRPTLRRGGPGFTDRASKRPAVPHGLRSTFRDWVAERTHFPGDMAAVALAHKVDSAVEASYRRRDMVEIHEGPTSHHTPCFWVRDWDKHHDSGALVVRFATRREALAFAVNWAVTRGRKLQTAEVLHFPVRPKGGCPVSLTLPPMASARDAARAAGAVLAAVADGDLTPSEGAQIMALVETCRRTLETTELEARIAALERNRT